MRVQLNTRDSHLNPDCAARTVATVLCRNEVPPDVGPLDLTDLIGGTKAARVDPPGVRAPAAPQRGQVQRRRTEKSTAPADWKRLLLELKFSQRRDKAVAAIIQFPQRMNASSGGTDLPTSHPETTERPLSSPTGARPTSRPARGRAPKLEAS